MTKLDLTQILQDLVNKHGVGVLQERGPLIGRLLDGQHKQEAWLMETAHEAGVVDLLRKHPGESNRRKAVRQLRQIHGLAQQAALQVVQALTAALGHAQTQPGLTGVWLRRTMAFAALLGLSAVGVLAAAFAWEQTERYQINTLADIKRDLPRLQQALQEINDNAETRQKQLQAEIAETKRQLHAMLPAMVAIKGGCFQMGSPANEANRDHDELQHEVCVQPFKLGKYEVTQAQWQAVMGSNPSYFKNCGGKCPVEQVSFNDAQVYIAKLNQLTGQNYRLPTEAEWEYACRGGKQQTRCGSDDAGAVAWYSNNSGGTTHSVGKKQANDFGLYDMSGNVWEWTCSGYADAYNGSEKTCTNDAADSRVLRGGAWNIGDRAARSAARYAHFPDSRSLNYGFRLVQD